jgi:MAE_28990/MAE_18760-like HEPN
MPSPESVYEDLEGDHRSREGEVRLIERLLQQTTVEDEQTMLKRTLILLLYAHLEGFCKFALLSYTASLNALGLKCSEAAYPIVAATLSQVFAALRDPNSKHDAFRRSLPDDARLHLSAREQRFIESYDKISGQNVEIPDRVVDTQSNLSSNVLKKVMFQLGLDYPAVENHQENMNQLLGIRNAIAHGDRLKIPTDKQVADFSTTTFVLMRFLQGEVYSALKDRIYLRHKEPT